MNTKIIFGIISIFGILLMSGCLKNEEEEFQKEEQAKLEEYITKHNITVPPTASGLYYIEKTPGSGNIITSNDYLLLYMDWYMIDGTLVGTTDTALAAKDDIFPFVYYKGPLKLKVGSTGLKGLSEGLMLMKEGGSAQLIIPSNLAYGGANVAYGSGSNKYIPSYSTIIVDIYVVKVINDPVADDSIHIERWLNYLQLQRTYLTDSIYMIFDKGGTGNLATDGDTIKFQYKVQTLDSIYSIGKSYYINSNYIVGESNFLPGLVIALEKMKKGSEARVIIPYNMAAGAQGKYNSTSMLIPPYTSLYYQLVISNIIKP